MTHSSDGAVLEVLEAIRADIRQLLDKQANDETSGRRWLTAREMCQKFAISHTTLTRMANEGRVKRMYLSDKCPRYQMPEGRDA